MFKRNKVNFTHIHNIGVRVCKINSVVSPSYISAKCHHPKKIKDNQVHREITNSNQLRIYF